ncbi:MAG: hypothetical protein JXA30_22995 [Deltaproteobacteria bacterium]|nr:hypothetical protein [Deltaproteobacteria bacterium]
MRYRGLLIIFFTLAICSCGSAHSSPHAKAVSPSFVRQKTTGHPSERELLLARAASAWTRRTERLQLEEAIAYWRRAVALDANDVDTWNRLSRAHAFWLELLCISPPIPANGDQMNAGVRKTSISEVEPRSNESAPLEVGTGECDSSEDADGEDERRNARFEMLKQGIEAAEHALLLLSPSLIEQIEGVENEHNVDLLVETNAVPSIFWRSTMMDEWARMLGYAERIVHKHAVTASMTLCLNRDEHYYFAGPHRYFGTFYARPLSPADKNLAKSKLHFERAVEIAPRFLANRYTFARDYAVMAQDRQTFETQLRLVLEANPDDDPSTAPENRVYQQKAERLFQQASDLFE